MRLDVKIDLRAAKAALDALASRDARAAVNQALGRATRSTQAEASRIVREELNIKATALSSRNGRTITTTRPSALAASVKIRGQGLPLSQFKGTRQTKLGLSVQVLKGKPRTVLGSRFLHPLTGTSVDRAKLGSRRVPRTPIRVSWGPAIAQVLGRPAVLERLKGHAVNRFGVELRRELNYRLKRRTGAP